MAIPRSEYVSYVALENDVRIQVPIISSRFRTRQSLPDPNILLHPNIPLPMSKTAPREILGQDWWDTVRRRAYAHWDFRCWACSVHRLKANGYKRLEAHEYYDIDYEKGRLFFRGLTALCHYCHNFIHDKHMLYRCARGDRQYPPAKCAKVIEHGLKVLNAQDCLGISPKKAKMRDVQEYRADPARLAKTLAAWEDWRLVIDGVEFRGYFATQEDCERFYLGADVHA